MSRVGKKIIPIPSTVQIVREGDVVTVTGPKGSLTMKMNPFVSLAQEEGVLHLTVDKPNDKFQRSVWGTSRAVLANLITGVTQGFKKELELNGVGYRMELGSDLVLYIGYSHPVRIKVPTSIKLQLNKNVLTGESMDKHLIGDFFTTIHNMKPCDVYKQKGFKFPGRVYRKKVGKKAK